MPLRSHPANFLKGNALGMLAIAAIAALTGCATSDQAACPTVSGIYLQNSEGEASLALSEAWTGNTQTGKGAKVEIRQSDREVTVIAGHQVSKLIEGKDYSCHRQTMELTRQGNETTRLPGVFAATRTTSYVFTRDADGTLVLLTKVKARTESQGIKLSAPARGGQSYRWKPILKPTS